MQILGFTTPEAEEAGGRLAIADDIRQAVLAVGPELEVEVVDADGDQLVRVTGAGGTVIFSTAAYPQLRPDGQPYFRGWAWRADTPLATSSPREQPEHWRALAFWPGQGRRGAGAAVPAVTGRWRTDKTPEDATTVAEVVGLHHTARRSPAST